MEEGLGAHGAGCGWEITGSAAARKRKGEAEVLGRDTALRSIAAGQEAGKASKS